MGKRKLLVGETAPWEFLLSAVLPKIIICAAIPARNRLQLHISTHRIGAWRKQEITPFSFFGFFLVFLEILAVGSTIHFLVEYGRTRGSCVGVLQEKKKSSLQSVSCESFLFRIMRLITLAFGTLLTHDKDVAWNPLSTSSGWFYWAYGGRQNPNLHKYILFWGVRHLPPLELRGCCQTVSVPSEYGVTFPKSLPPWKWFCNA